MEIRTITEENHEWISTTLRGEWGDEIVITRGKEHNAGELPGFIAYDGDNPVGLLIYRIENGEMEIVSLNSNSPGGGFGTALVNTAWVKARHLDLDRIWLVTTNDNTDALRFYQRRGFRIIKVYPGEVNEARKIKPEIPFTGNADIPIRDEIELEILLRNKDN